jgi:Mn2+/Fe2+ NRAMP family transporter
MAVSTTISGRIGYLPRSVRRLLVAAALLGYPVAVAALVGLKHTSLNRWLILAIFLAIILAITVLVLVGYAYARGRIDGRGGRLDERDLALRQQAYALSHRVLAVILIAATAALTIYLTSGNTLRLDANSFWPALMWVIVYIPALPALMLAWIESDQPADA